MRTYVPGDFIITRRSCILLIGRPDSVAKVFEESHKRDECWLTLSQKGDIDVHSESWLRQYTKLNDT